ncbi:LysR family transcriptional regulator [Erysipelothrix aquatica]|uniref:LysR family transcriptional regulator n=1 Tax=Erysipelothrix aquatica TaxID=2683714 RepID=UPI001357FBE1|nr:LysR family transcriptional regulator [Erysipelothrix aquatica]
MDLRHIQSFVKVVEKQSFSKAAQELGYTQAAITIQIKQLEETLGTKLFDRIHRKVRLTEDGEAFIFYANDILRTFNRARSFKNDEESVKTIIRVGTVGSLGSHFFPDFIYTFSQQYPLVELKIIIGTTKSLTDMIHRNEIDIMYTIDELIYEPELVNMMREPEPIYFVTKDPNIKAQKYALDEISDYPFLLTEKGEAYRYELERHLAHESVDLNAIVEVGEIGIITKVLKKGLGIAYLPYFSVKDDVDSHALNIVDVDIPNVTMWRQVMVHEKKFLSKGMKDFLETITKK